MNVTISLRDELVKEARHLAVDKGVSLSKYIASILEEELGKERSWGEARERQRRMMAEGLHIGMPEKVTWTRDQLHER